jgi:hypothetical protein
MSGNTPGLVRGPNGQVVRAAPAHAQDVPGASGGGGGSFTPDPTTHDPTAMQLPAGTTDPNTPVYADSTWEGTLGDRQFRSVYKPNDFRNFMYGGTPGGADEAVQLAQGTGAGAQKTGENLLALGLERSRLAGERDIFMADWARQNQALGTAGGYGNQLAGLEATQGPSAAQYQLQQGTNAAMGGQLALARSGRGFGGGAAAAGLAQGNLAGIQANAANEAAMLRAQEDAAWRQRQAANLGQAAGIQQGIGSQFGEQGARDINAYNAGLAQNDAASMGWFGQGAGAYNAGVQQNLSGQSLGTQIRGMELSARQNLEDQMLRRWAAENGFEMQAAAAQAQQNAALIQGISTTGGTIIGTAFGGPAGGVVGGVGGNAAGKAVTS